MSEATALALSRGAITHRNGGTILALTHIAHRSTRGVAEWFFVGDVLWDSGTRTSNREIPPLAVCGDPDDVRPFMAALAHYLEHNGEWHDQKHTRDGRVYSWTPKKPDGREELSV